MSNPFGQVEWDNELFDRTEEELSALQREKRAHIKWLEKLRLESHALVKECPTIMELWRKELRIGMQIPKMMTPDDWDSLSFGERMSYRAGQFSVLDWVEAQLELPIQEGEDNG